MQIPTATLVLLLPAFLSLTTLAFPVVADGNLIIRSSNIGGDHMTADLKRDKLPTEDLVARSSTEPEKCHGSLGLPVSCSDPTSTYQLDKVNEFAIKYSEPFGKPIGLPARDLVARSPTEPETCHNDAGKPVPCADASPSSTPSTAAPAPTSSTAPAPTVYSHEAPEDFESKHDPNNPADEKTNEYLFGENQGQGGGAR